MANRATDLQGLIEQAAGFCQISITKLRQSQRQQAIGKFLPIIELTIQIYAFLQERPRFRN